MCTSEQYIQTQFLDHRLSQAQAKVSSAASVSLKRPQAWGCGPAAERAHHRAHWETIRTANTEGHLQTVVCFHSPTSLKSLSLVIPLAYYQTWFCYSITFSWYQQASQSIQMYVKARRRSFKARWVYKQITSSVMEKRSHMCLRFLLFFALHLIITS